MIKELSLESLHEVQGGEIKKDFDSLLATLINDCQQRPAIDKARTLTIKIEITPAPDDTGHCESCDMRAVVTSKQPARAIVIPKMKSRKKGSGSTLVFDPQLDLFEDA